MAVQSCKELFETYLPTRLKSKPELSEKINSTYKFVVNGDGGGTWVVDLTQPGGVITATNSDAACTITVGAADLVGIVNGTLNAQMAFMSGKLKVAGDMGLAMKLQSLFG